MSLWRTLVQSFKPAVVAVIFSAAVSCIFLDFLRQEDGDHVLSNSYFNHEPLIKHLMINQPKKELIQLETCKGLIYDLNKISQFRNIVVKS